MSAQPLREQPTSLDTDVAAYALRLGDDALVLGQRLCEWAAKSPQIEEDVALLNLALDHLGAARSLLTHAGELRGRGESEDDLAFLRDEPHFTNALLMELESGDFGRTMARQLLVAAYQLLLWQALSASTDATVAGVAGKAVKEVAYHLDHARSWVVRLGDGTPESHRRVQAGLDGVWPYAAELFERDEQAFTNALLMELEGGDFGRTMARQLLVAAYQLPLWQALSTSADAGIAGVADKSVKEVAYHLDHARSWVVRLGDGTAESHRRVQAGLDAVWPYAFELFERDPLTTRLVDAGVAADPVLLEPQWRATVEAVLAEATLTVPEATWRPTGGRSGAHTTGFGYLLAELQHLHRSHPGVSW